ncbi:unnamed protein product [Parnassius apollo]|uniref:(apollo) hypothetical protein n=1 Tax=Parnassius apollo TaxID=110799 RepID=A0A8S3WA47_PARAO|nr:unnamed protein product [Parnassius apollo]
MVQWATLHTTSRRALTPHEQCALCRALYALAHAHAHADDTYTLEALSKCGETAVPILLRFVCHERSPSVRRAALGWLSHSHSQSTLLAIAQQAATCVDPASTTKSIGLDIAQMLISALKDENTLVKTVLPELIIQISNTRELYAETAFNNATELLIDKIELFENEVLKSITINLLKVLCSSQNGGTSHGMADIRIMRKFTKMTIEFLKRLGEYKGNNLFDVVDDIFMIVGKKVVEFSRLFYVLSVVKEVYQLDTDRCRNILLREGNYISNILFDERENQVSLDYLHLEAVLKFCTVYAEVLLELHYEGTLNFLSRILTKLHPYQVELQYASIFTCLTKCREILKSTPRILITSFENWCRKLPVEDIRGNLQRYKFSKEDMALVKSLKLMLECFDITDPGFADLNRHTQNWLHCVQELNESGYIERNMSKLPYLTDLLHVLFRFLTVTDVKSVISICGEEFCAIFMPALFHYFVRQPYLLLDHNLEKFCGLLNEIVKYYVRKCNLEEYCDLILNLVDTLWPKYESVCDFKKKHSLLVDMLSLPRKLGPYSNPMQWIMDSIRSDECSCEMKAKLIGVLPTGEAYSGTWQCFLGLVPARLGDARGEQSLMLRALLDALLVADCSLLDHLCQLVSGDTEKGWWDDAIDACMVTLASRNDITIYETVYKKCSDGLSLGVCNRLMVPLLRCSNASLCEEFFSSKLKDLLAVLRKRPRGATAHYIYHKAVVDYLRALILLKVAFEKIPRAHIESPNSVLYKRMSAEVQDNIFYLAKTVAMCCVELEAKKVVVCPAGADQKLKNNCLLFHCENYNCLTAAIFCREPKESKFYDLIYNEAAWNRIVDPDVTYDLPLRAQWRKRTVKQAVSVELSSDSPLLGRSLTRTSARTRTRTFLHTLSENPLDFDLQLPCDEQDDGHEMSVSESSVNEHACAATLTAATSRICLLPISSWQHRIAAALRAHLHHNVKWLLAQVICNCTEDVKSHASILRPALLEMIVQTSSDGAGGVLNGLHVQILDTIIQWRGETNELESDAIDNLNVTIERLIATCIRNARRQQIVNDLIERMNSLLEMYGTVVKIGWTCFQDYMEARNTSAPKTYLQILKNITKRKIHIPELLPNLIQTLESRQDRNSRLANLANQVDLGQLAQLFGRALAAAPVSTRFEMLKRYRNVLEKNKSDVSEYIKLLYNAQVEFPEVCDGLHFRRVTDLATKVVGRNKTKCLEILSMYIAKASRDEDITAMFETIEISELMVRGDEIVLGLVMNGLLVMGEQLKRRVILQCVEHCSHPVWKVRKAALGVLLKAFEGLIVPSAEESNPKRPAKLNNPLMRDVGFNKPMAAFGLGLVCEPDTGDLRDAMSRHLTAAGLVKRFCETFIITVHLPVLHAACSEKYVSVCVSVLLDIFFKDLRENEAFKRTLLRDQPLESTSSAATVKTVARTASRPASNQDNATTEEIKSVDDALGALLQFAKSSPEVASALCLQVMSALNSRTSSGFDFAATMSELLVPMLGRISDLTPFLVEACRLFVDECCHINGFKETVEALVKTAKGTEGQCLVQALYEDVLIRCPGLNYFILSKINHDNEDWDMTELNKHFSLEDLVASFGMLSNWEDLTLQQRTSVESSLPPLWVDIDTYKVELDGRSDTSSNSWFDKMASVYRKGSYLSMKWLSELLRWPRSLFSTSATVEAIQLEKMQKESFDDFLKYLSCDIRPVDCLAEWAARILTRAAYLEKATEEYRNNYTDSKSLSLSHALQWCLSANERELPSQVLRCVSSFIREKTTTLPWLSQELIAKRKLALRSNIEGDLAKILERAETEGALLSQGAPLEDIIEINHLTLLLHRDLNSLTKEKLQYTLNNMQQQYLKASEGAIVQGRNKQMLQSMVELAIMHYDGLWKEVNDSEEQNTILTDICSALDPALSLNLNLKYSNLLDVILNRLSDFAGYKLSDEATSAVLGTIETLIHEMDDFAMDEIKRNIFKFSSQRSSELIAKLEREEVETSKFKKCLQLVADAEYALKQYCRGLRGALERDDGVEWSQIFNRMKEKIFENPYAGPDYQVLSKYHTVLYSISDFDHMDKTSAKQTLQRLTNELSSNKQTLRLSQLCPTLAQATILRGSETDDCLSRLLMLPRGVHFLKFEEQVSVFTESVRRPVVVTVRLSDGNTRPLLVKGGESLRRDAAALRLLRGLPIPAQQHYQVTPLSEDCGLIEYLEDHERLRALISSKYDVDGILASVSRASDDELILKPREDCIKEFERICSKLPSYALRSVIEMRSSCIEDFISKKQQFEEGLSVMTFVTWLLGVGDRHLDNILMSLRHGSVCSVDWNCVLRHGRAELPPARLTRNLLALCRPTVLESRLQKLTAASRDSHRLLLPVLQVSFRWMGKEVENELADVSDLLRGEALPHQVSQRAGLRSVRKYSHKYSQLLERIFADYSQKDKYSVEEQVSNLLRHCTDPQILGVTRSNWEPWI